MPVCEGTGNRYNEKEDQNGSMHSGYRLAYDLRGLFIGSLLEVHLLLSSPKFAAPGMVFQQ